MNRVILIGALISISSSFAHTVRVDFDHAAHFGSYRTYCWGESPGHQSSATLFPNQLMEHRIAGFIEEALASRGLKRVATCGDLVVSYRMIVTEQPQFVTFGDGPGFGWDWGWADGYSVTTVATFYEGTLVIDITDLNRNKLVFQGTSTQSVSSRAAKNTEKLGEAVRKIMVKYPPQQ